MVLTFLTCLFLLLQSPESEVQYVDITGGVTFADSNPLHGATVMVVGTSLGAMTDSSGCYLIENCPVSDSLSLLSRMVGMCEETRVVHYNGDDIDGVDFLLRPCGSYIPSLSSREVEHVFTDTVTINVKNWYEVNLSMSRVWQHTGILCPAWVVNDSTMKVALPSGENHTRLWIYPGKTINLGLVDTSRTLDVLIPIDLDSPLAVSGNSVAHCIDLKRWGNENLQRFGFLGAEIQGETASSSRILLVYNEQAVLINEFADTTIVEFPFPTFYYRVDSTLSYLLIWDIYGQNAISGDVALISLESGQVSLFDPTPDIDESRWTSHTGYLFSPGNMFSTMEFHVSSSGKILWLGDEYFRSYDRFGNLQNEVALFSVFPDDVYYRDQLFNDENEELSAVFYSGSDFFMRISNTGRIYYTNEIEPWRHYLSPNRNNPFNPLTEVAWIAQGERGALRLDFESGEMERVDDTNAKSIVSSPDHSILGFIDSSGESSSVRILDWVTSEEISSFRLPIFNDQRANTQLLALSSGGDCLFKSSVQGTFPSYHLRGFRGKALWTIAEVPSALNYECSFLSDGSVVFGVGEYIVIHTPTCLNN